MARNTKEPGQIGNEYYGDSPIDDWAEDLRCEACGRLLTVRGRLYRLPGGLISSAAYERHRCPSK